MDTIIIYFSILGNNKRIATEIANENNYEIIEFAPGTMLRVFQFFMRKKRLVKKAKALDIQEYDNLIICGPIWGGKPAPAIIKLLETLEINGKNVSCYFTFGQDFGNTEELAKEIIESKGGNSKEIIFNNISKKETD
jgi:flavodoxin